MNDTDRQILALLRENSRISVTDIAKKSANIANHGTEAYREYGG
jgi:hypothetical protein